MLYSSGQEVSSQNEQTKPIYQGKNSNMYSIYLVEATPRDKDCKCMEKVILIGQNEVDTKNHVPPEVNLATFQIQNTM